MVKNGCKGIFKRCDFNISWKIIKITFLKKYFWKSVTGFELVGEADQNSSLFSCSLNMNQLMELEAAMTQYRNEGNLQSLVKAVEEIEAIIKMNTALDIGDNFLRNYKQLAVPVCPLADRLYVCPVCPEVGAGLFTGVAIPKGTWITNYGCDSLLLKECEEYIASGEFSAKQQARLSAMVKTHALDVEHPHVQRIASNKMNEDPNYLAHMANDGPGPSFLDNLKIQPTMFNASLKYLQQVKSTCNAAMVRHRNGTATLRAVVDIPAGSEICWAYGFDYWATDKWFDDISQAELQIKMCPPVGSAAYNVFKQCTTAFEIDCFFQSPSPCNCTTCI